MKKLAEEVIILVLYAHGEVMPLVCYCRMQIRIRWRFTCAIFPPKFLQVGMQLVVLDKAGWHTTKKLPHLQNLTLLPLPAASPELNPSEQVWKHLRRTRLSNRTFKNEKELLDACSDAWNELSGEREQVSSLTSRARARL